MAVPAGKMIRESVGKKERKKTRPGGIGLLSPAFAEAPIRPGSEVHPCGSRTEADGRASTARGAEQLG